MSVDERSPLLPQLPSSAHQSQQRRTPRAFSRPAIVIAVGAWLHMMGICANYTYALISSRAFICAAHYEQHPLDPGLHCHTRLTCRTPQVEVALASYVRNLCLLAGIINPLAILFWGRFLRILHPKGLALVANLAVILFDPLPWLLLPLGPPVGKPNPYLSPTASKKVLLLSATLGAATGMGNLHTLAFRTMLVDIASPAQITAHLSLFALAAYASTALGPLVSGLVVNVVQAARHRQRHHDHHSTGSLSSPGTLLFLVRRSPREQIGELPVPAPPLGPPQLDPAVSHQRVSFSVSLLFSIAALLWLVFLIPHSHPQSQPPFARSQNPQDEETAAAASTGQQDEVVPQAELAEDDAKAYSPLRRRRRSRRREHHSLLLELLRPFRVLHPDALRRHPSATRPAPPPPPPLPRPQSTPHARQDSSATLVVAASSSSSPQLGGNRHKVASPSTSPPLPDEAEEGGEDEDGEEGEGEGGRDWTLARIAAASVLASAAATAISPLMEYLTFRYGFNGTQLSFLLSAQAAVSALLVLLGVPALRALVERRTSNNIAHGAAAVDVSLVSTASAAASTADDAYIELRASSLVLLAVLLPWSLILAGVAWPSSGAGAVSLLVLGWIFGSPDGSIGSFLQAGGLAVLKSKSQGQDGEGQREGRGDKEQCLAGARQRQRRRLDDFLTAYNTLATLVTLAASLWVTFYAWTIRHSGPFASPPLPPSHGGRPGLCCGG
ncbi:hypothetical protein OC844_004031 [Tilletia horrida]|nr:hypothetical protein OC844_004031 [Tilletia horrida]